jgi:hypothetical protein
LRAAQHGLRWHPRTDSGMSVRCDTKSHLLLDTGHLAWAGGKSMQAIKDYGHRIARILGARI